MDGYEWSNNSGTITADVTQIVPEPEIYAMLFAGLALLWLATGGGVPRKWSAEKLPGSSGLLGIELSASPAAMPVA